MSDIEIQTQRLRIALERAERAEDRAEAAEAEVKGLRVASRRVQAVTRLAELLDQPDRPATDVLVTALKNYLTEFAISHGAEPLTWHDDRATRLVLAVALRVTEGAERDIIDTLLDARVSSTTPVDLRHDYAEDLRAAADELARQWEQEDAA
jgi:hypothetical protein